MKNVNIFWERLEKIFLVWLSGGESFFGMGLRFKKCATGTFGEERYPFAYSLGELFFVRKVPLTLIYR